MNNWQLLACLISIFVVSQAQTTDCVQGVYTQVDSYLYNGLLPTHIAEKVINSGSNQLQGATLLLTNNYTLNANSFVAIVSKESSTVTGQANAGATGDEGHQDGQIQVNNQSVRFEVEFTLSYHNSTVSGIAVIPRNYLSYNFSIKFQDAPAFYNLTMLPEDFSFEISNVTNILPNFPVTKEQLQSLIQQLNDNQTIQTALSKYFNGYNEKFVKVVQSHIPSNLDNVNYSIPSESELDLTLSAQPNLQAFAIFYTQPIQYQMAFQTTVEGIVTPVCSNYTIPATLKKSQYQQELYSTSFLQNLFAQAVEINAFDTVLNSTNWPVPYLSWFTGGWKSINASVYENNPLDTVLSGNCTLLRYNYIGPSNVSANNSLIFDFQYNCILVASANSSMSIQLNLNQVSVAIKFNQINQYNYKIQYYVAGVGGHTTVPSQEVLGARVEWYLNAAINMYIGQNFGDAIPTTVNQAPLNYMFDYEGLSIYSLFANPIQAPPSPTPSPSSNSSSSADPIPTPTPTPQPQPQPYNPCDDTYQWDWRCRGWNQDEGWDYNNRHRGGDKTYDDNDWSGHRGGW